MVISPHGKPVDHIGIHPPMIGRPGEAAGCFRLGVGNVALLVREWFAQPPPER
jgi:hypothetical protein